MGKQISLLSFNTLGTTFFAPNIKERYKKIAQIINAKKIDIVCLQEIGTYYNLMIIKRYLKGFPYCVYIPQVTGPKGGLVIFSKYPTAHTNYYKYTSLGSFKNITFYSKLLQNGILSCRLMELNLTIMNTHTVTDFEFKPSPTNKYLHLVENQVMQAASNMNYEKNAVVLVGDFNMAKDSPLYTSFLNKTNALDPFKEYKTPTYHPERLHYRFKGKSSERIDFIFLKQKHVKFDKMLTEQLFDEEVVLKDKKKWFLSDHSGLKITFHHK